MEFIREELTTRYTEPAKQAFDSFGHQANAWLADFAAAAQDPSTYDHAFAMCIQRHPFPAAQVKAQALPQFAGDGSCGPLTTPSRVPFGEVTKNRDPTETPSERKTASKLEAKPIVTTTSTCLVQSVKESYSKQAETARAAPKRVFKRGGKDAEENKPVEPVIAPQQPEVVAVEEEDRMVVEAPIVALEAPVVELQEPVPQTPIIPIVQEVATVVEDAMAIEAPTIRTSTEPIALEAPPPPLPPSAEAEDPIDSASVVEESEKKKKRPAKGRAKQTRAKQQKHEESAVVVEDAPEPSRGRAARSKQAKVALPEPAEEEIAVPTVEEAPPSPRKEKSPKKDPNSPKKSPKKEKSPKKDPNSPKKSPKKEKSPNDPNSPKKSPKSKHAVAEAAPIVAAPISPIKEPIVAVPEPIEEKQPAPAKSGRPVRGGRKQPAPSQPKPEEDSRPTRATRQARSKQVPVEAKPIVVEPPVVSVGDEEDEVIFLFIADEPKKRPTRSTRAAKEEKHTVAPTRSTRNAGRAKKAAAERPVEPDAEEAEEPVEIAPVKATKPKANPKKRGRAKQQQDPEEEEKQPEVQAEVPAGPAAQPSPKRLSKRRKTSEEGHADVSPALTLAEQLVLAPTEPDVPPPPYPSNGESSIDAMTDDETNDELNRTMFVHPATQLNPYLHAALAAEELRNQPLASHVESEYDPIEALTSDSDEDGEDEGEEEPPIATVRKSLLFSMNNAADASDESIEDKTMVIRPGVVDSGVVVGSVPAAKKASPAKPALASSTSPSTTTKTDRMELDDAGEEAEEEDEIMDLSSSASVVSSLSHTTSSNVLRTGAVSRGISNNSLTASTDDTMELASAVAAKLNAQKPKEKAKPITFKERQDAAEAKRAADKAREQKEQDERRAKIQQKLAEADKRKAEMKKNKEATEASTVSANKKATTTAAPKAAAPTKAQPSIVPQLKTSVTSASYSQSEKQSYAAMLKEKIAKAKAEKTAGLTKTASESSLSESASDSVVEAAPHSTLAHSVEVLMPPTSASSPKKGKALTTKLASPRKAEETPAEDTPKATKSFWSMLNPFSIVTSVLSGSGSKKQKATQTPGSTATTTVTPARRLSDPSSSPSISRSPLLKSNSRRLSDSSAANSRHGSPVAEKKSALHDAPGSPTSSNWFSANPPPPSAVFSPLLNSTIAAPALMGPPMSPSIKSPRYKNPAPAGPSTAFAAAVPQQHEFKTPPKPKVKVDAAFFASPEVQYPVVDFDDDDTPEKYGSVPKWTNKTLLMRALEAQQTIDPDEVFGTDWSATCDLAEIFQVSASTNNQRQFERLTRPRSSSAHWTPDKMAMERGMAEYKKRMGWVKSPSHAPK